MSATPQPSARELLERYLRESHEPPSPSVLRRLVKRVLSDDVAERLQVSLTRLDAPRQRRRARSLPSEGLRLHLGSGHTRLPGWVNIDLIGYKCDLTWDLGRPLPFAPGAADAVFSEHVLEHLPLLLGLTLMSETHRVLRPGGVVRIGVPDGHRYAESYLAGGAGVIDEHRPGRPTPLLAMQEIYFRHGHTTMYDEETLILLLRAAGFDETRVAEFGNSDIVPCPDSESRRAETVYVEAVRS